MCGPHIGSLAIPSQKYVFVLVPLRGRGRDRSLSMGQIKNLECRFGPRFLIFGYYLDPPSTFHERCLAEPDIKMDLLLHELQSEDVVLLIYRLNRQVL